MTMTATIAIDDNTAIVNQYITATVTVSNSGGSPVNVLSIAPVINMTGGSAVATNSGVAVGDAFLGPGATIAVANSGSTKFKFAVVFFAPNATTFDVGCIVQSSDGSIFSPTPVTVTVSQYS